MSAVSGIGSDPLSKSSIEAATVTARPSESTPLQPGDRVHAEVNAKEGTPGRIGRLIVEDKIGEGRMGAVYRAFDPDLRRVVAVRVLPVEMGADDRARIIGESRALARLSHPSVVAIYDVKVAAEGELYLTMEYVDGLTLSAWKREHADAPWEEVVSLFLQAARGFAAAHDVGLVHGDFEPGSVLVGEDGRVRVIDFGLARVSAETRPSARLASTAEEPRSVAQQIEREEEATPLSDQRSFCAALLSALRDGRSEGAARREPLRLHAILERGLDPTPSRRWPSMKTLADALERLLEPSSAGYDRDLLLDRVEALWLQGMLKDSLVLTDGHPIALDLELMQNEVVPPWTGLGVVPFPKLDGWTTIELEELLEASHHALLILGEPGAGKTTAMLILTRALLKAARGDPAAPAPIVLSLASFDPRRSALADWIAGELVTKYGIPSQRARAWAEDDGLALMLDGLDEVPGSRRRACAEAIDAFRDEHPVSMVLSCREAEYRNLGTKLGFGAAVRVRPLTDAQLTMLLRESPARALADALESDANLREQLRNPLMLGLLVVSGVQPSASSLENAWTSTLRRYVEHALGRGTSSGNDNEKLVRGLTWMARAMKRRNTADFWLERLQASWLERPWEQWAARVLGATAISALTFGDSVLAQLSVGLDPAPSIMNSLIAVVFVWVLVRSLRVQPVESLG